MHERRPRVAVVRISGRAESVMAELTRRGADPLLVPALVIRPPSDPQPLREAVEDIDEYDGILLGSVASAQALVSHGLERYDGPVFCVGEATRQRVEDDPDLARALVGPKVEAKVARSEGLLDAVESYFPDGLSGRVFLFPHAEEGREYLQRALRERGARVHAPCAYRVAPAARLPEDVQRGLASVESFLFFSGEAVRAFLHCQPEDEARQALERGWVGVIGPAGAERAEALGVRVDAYPEEPGAEALIELWSQR